MTEIIVANDIGTTQVKSICTYKSRPNSSNRVDFNSVLGEPVELLSVDDELMRIKTADGDWFIGKSAEMYSRNQIWGRGNGWALSQHYLALHLYAISSHVGNSTREVDCYLMSGLPRADYQSKEEVAKYLSGEFVIQTAKRKHPLLIRIRQVYFAIQGLSAIMAEGYKEDTSTVWLGLGGRNKTYATINSYGKVNPEKTNSNEGGLLDVVDKLEGIVGQKYNIELSKQKWIQALQDKYIQLGRTQLDISGEAEIAIRPYIDATFSLIRGIWNERNDMPFISDFRIGGGGALEIGDEIAEKYPQARVVDNPRWTEAEGLLKLGLARYLS